MGIDGSFNEKSLNKRSGIWVEDSSCSEFKVCSGPRIGVDDEGSIGPNFLYRFWFSKKIKLRLCYKNVSVLAHALPLCFPEPEPEPAGAGRSEIDRNLLFMMLGTARYYYDPETRRMLPVHIRDWWAKLGGSDEGTIELQRIFIRFI